MGLFVLAFWWGGAVFSLLRAQRIWRDPAYFERVASQRALYSKKFRRGLLRGWLPFSIGIASMAIGLPLMMESGENGTSGIQQLLLVVGLVLLLVFMAGIVLQVSIAWFNFPRGLVPPYLRHEHGNFRNRKKA